MERIYILKKDLPGLKAGAEFKATSALSFGYTGNIEGKIWIELPPSVIQENEDWFELKIKKPYPPRIIAFTSNEENLFKYFNGIIPNYEEWVDKCFEENLTIYKCEGKCGQIIIGDEVNHFASKNKFKVSYFIINGSNFLVACGVNGECEQVENLIIDKYR